MNVAEKLAAELVRVTTIRCHYESLRDMSGVYVVPAIDLMTAAIEAGIKAAGVCDALTQIQAIKSLEGFSE